CSRCTTAIPRPMSTTSSTPSPATTGRPPKASITAPRRHPASSCRWRISNLLRRRGRVALQPVAFVLGIAFGAPSLQKRGAPLGIAAPHRRPAGDTVGAEMAEGLAQFAPADQQADMVEEAE